MLCPLGDPPHPPCQGCLAPMVQLAHKQDPTPRSTHDLELTRSQASFPRDMMDVSTLESGSELSVSWYQELCGRHPCKASGTWVLWLGSLCGRDWLRVIRCIGRMAVSTQCPPFLALPFNF